MPVYSYTCKNCKEEFSFFYSFDEKHATECKNCKGKLKRNFSNISINFRGEGFYSNKNTSPTNSSATSEKK